METIQIKEPSLGKQDNFFGDRSVVLSKKQRKYVLSNEITKRLYISDIGFYPFAKNHFRTRKEGINEHILIYCIDGKGVIQEGGKSSVLNSNAFYVIKAGNKHKYWSSEDSPWSIYWLHFGGKLSENFKDFYGRPIPIDKSNQSRINDRLVLFNEILTALEAGFTNESINYSNMSLYNLLASFFYVETFRLVKGYTNVNPVDKSIAFMQRNISKNLKIKEIAEYVRLSESHFSKQFRNKTGTSPLEYFINLKMQEAIRLLTNQSLKIKEVAFKLGYSDQYYFTRIFTKHIGSSPASFIKTINR